MKNDNKYFTPVISLVLIIFAAMLFLTYLQTSETKKSATLVAHTQDVLFRTSHVQNIITNYVTDTRGFVLTADPDFIQRIQKSKNEIYKQIDSLRQLTMDNAAQQARIDSLMFYINKRIAFSDAVISSRKEKG